MEVKAYTKYLPISPQKLALVVDQVRGMDAEEALVVLQYMPQKGSEFVYKTVASALATSGLGSAHMISRWSTGWRLIVTSRMSAVVNATGLPPRTLRSNPRWTGSSRILQPDSSTAAQTMSA